MGPEGRVLIPAGIRRAAGMEPGADTVDPLLAEAAIPSVNWSEVLQKVTQRGRDARGVGNLLLALGLEVVSFSADDAASAVALCRQGPSLSLGDRCCLALARRLGVPAMTGDKAWLTLRIGVDVRSNR